MEHPDDEVLWKFSCGKLPLEELEELALHLDTCNVCGDRIDQLASRSDALLDNLSADLPDETLIQVSAPSAAGVDNGQLDAPAHYQVLSELGRGGMGIVYKALDLRVDRHVALKIIAPQRGWLPTDRDRFQVEAKAAAHLHHANIVQLFEFSERNGVLFCAFEYVPGGTLAQRLSSEKLTNAETAKIMATVADAVEYAHESAVLHRDLKPENILITPNGTPKITDFGLAKRLDQIDSRTLPGTPMGTPAYMSPEQANGEPEVGRTTDIYSLGAIIYECLAGRPVFEGNVLTVLEQVRSSEPIRPRKLDSTIDLDLEAICLKCLEKSPKRRFQNARELAAELRRFSAGVPVRSRAPNVLERIGKAARRNPVTATFVTLFVASVITAFLGVGWFNMELSFSLDQERRISNALQLQRATSLARSDPIKARTLLEDPTSFRPALRNTYWSLLHAACSLDANAIPETSGATAMDVSADGRLLAVGTQTGITVVSTSGLTPLHSTNTQAEITAIQFSQDSRTIVATGKQGLVTVWDLDSPSAKTFAFDNTTSVDSNFVVFVDTRTILTGHADGTTRSSSLETGTLSTTTKTRSDDSILCLAMNADRTLLATCGGAPHGALKLWDATSWHELDSIALEEATSVAFHPLESDTLISTGLQLDVKQWLIRDGKLKQRDHFAAQITKKVSCLDFSPDGRLLAAGSYDGSVHVWDSQTRTRLLSLPIKEPVGSIAFEGSEHLFVGRLGRDVERYSLAPRLRPQLFIRSAPDDNIAHVEYEPQQDRIITGDDAGRIQIWDAVSGELRFRWQEPSQEAISSLALDAQGNPSWEVRGQLHFIRDHDVRTMNLPNDLFTDDLVHTPHGIMASCASLKRTSLVRGEEEIWRSGFILSDLSYASRADTCVALLDDPERSDTRLGPSFLWIGNPNTELDSPVPTLDYACRLALSSDGQRICVGSETGEVALYDLQGRLQSRTDLRQSAPITALAFSADSNTLVSADDDGRLTFWDPRTRPNLAEQGTLHINDLVAHDLVFDRRDRLLLRCHDGTVRILSP